VIQTGIGAAAAIGGGVVGAWANGRNQERVERQQRRERAAEVLAEVAAVLDDVAPPFPPTEHPTPVDRERLSVVTRRWGQLRMRLFVLGAVHPSAEVRELVEILQANLSLALESIRLLIRFLQEADPESKAEADVRRRLAERDEVERWHGAAHDTLRAVVEAIQQPERTGWWPPG
jgi:hypothetical protein